MKHILYLQQNGIVAIISGSKNVSILDLEKQVPVGLPHLIIDSAQLPETNHLELFRDALTADFDSPGQPRVRIDVEKAKNIAKDKIRQYRKELLATNDIVIRDAMLTNNTVTLNSALKQRDYLKDLTKVVNNVVDVNEILEKLEDLNIKV
jgi:hypothetical protein